MNPSTLRYDFYGRKSTEQDDRQVLSLDAQKREVAVKFPEIDPIHAEVEARSAKEPGRPVFNAMIERIRSGEIDGIVAYHPNRLSRNSVDTGLILYLLDKGHLKDLKFVTYTFENTPEGKWMLSLLMGQAKYDVDKLQRDVSVGNTEKYVQGGITWPAPPGYLNNTVTKQIEPDSERFHLIRQMWEMLLSQAYTVPQIWRIAREEWEYRTPKKGKIGGRPLALSSVYLIFRNPLYCGLNIRPNGNIYPCTHEAMISEEEYWLAQKILGKKGRAKPRRPEEYPYSGGLIKCGECGCSFTMEHKTKHLKSGKVLVFHYCRCTKKRVRCSQRYLPVHLLEAQIATALKPIPLEDDFATLVKQCLTQRAQEEAQRGIQRRGHHHRTQEDIQKELNELITMRRRSLIDDDEFTAQRNGLLQERSVALKDANPDRPAWLGPALRAIDFGCRCAFWFINGDVFDKKTILSAIGGSNLSILDGKLRFEPVGVFGILAHRPNNVSWSRLAEDIRHLMSTETQQPYVPELKPIPISDTSKSDLAGNGEESL